MVRCILSDLEGGGRLVHVSNTVSFKTKCLAAEIFTLTEYSSFLEKGSTVLFFTPFLPFDKRLFL